MNTKALLSVNALAAVIAIASIVMVSGVSEAPMIVADEEKAKGLYKMADGIQVVGTFEFRDGVEIVNIPDFSQGSEFSATEAPSFSFVKAVTDTPILHEAADTFWMFGSRDATYNHHYNDFEATIDIYQEGKHVRQFVYTDCKISGYKVDTLSDKEEAYNGKGFAVVEDYDIACTGYKPYAMDYEQMMEDKKPKSSGQLSSLDLLEQKSIWEQHTGVVSEVSDDVSFGKLNSQQKLGDKASMYDYRD